MMTEAADITHTGTGGKTAPTPISHDQVDVGASKKVAGDLGAWTNSTAWWVVKGTTGSGKTFFVEQLKDRILANKSPVIYVPQYPMFKPQLAVKLFIGLLPLSKKNKQNLYEDLAKLGVPTNVPIGGKLLGMLDVPGLSGGQRKKMLIAICVALAIEFQCPFLVLDEPFAGVDASAMRDVIGVMQKAENAVPNLKFFIVTHDHFDLLPKSAVLLEVVVRKVTSPNTDYANDNGNAAKDFAIALINSQLADPVRRSCFCLYTVKRHFIEMEFALPLVCYIISGTIIGAGMANYRGGLPGYGVDAIYTFMKVFYFEYPHLGNLIGYCYKRGQHYEDYYLNITTKEFAFVESLVIILLQWGFLWLVAEAVICGVCNFWWLSPEVALVDFNYGFQASIFYMMLPLVAPNPIIAMFCALPYLCFVYFFNGVFIPQEFFAGWLKWTSSFSPMFHFGCAYRAVSDEITITQTDCSDSLVLHMIFIVPQATLLLLAIAIKMYIAKYKRDKLVIMGLSATKKGSGAPSTTQTSLGDVPDKTDEIRVSRTSTRSLSEKPMDAAMRDAFSKNDWWVVKGATGAGKTFFLDRLYGDLTDAGAKVVFVPQYPMYKPQVPVMMYIKMLPLSRAIREDMIQNLKDMEVPLKGLVGGRAMGMIDLKGLSGGQRKKLMISTAVAIVSQFQSKFLVMDEAFAGIDLASMLAITKVLQKAIAASPGLKIIFSTHDHFATFKDMATVVSVDDRMISIDNGGAGYVKDNKMAAADFTSGMIKEGASGSRRLVDFYAIRRHFIENEYAMPLSQSALFGLLLGLVLLKYDGGHSGSPWAQSQVIFVWGKLFAFEYPLFGAIINFCYKREQHMEDYRLGAACSKYCFVETIITMAIQQSIIVLIADGLMAAIQNDFWWINPYILLLDMWYAIFAAVGYSLLPIVIPNPILCMASVFPYVCLWGYANGIILAKEWMSDATKWLTHFSPFYNMACAFMHATDKKEIKLEGTTCYDSIAPHVIFATPLTWFVAFGIVVRILIAACSKRK